MNQHKQPLKNLNLKEILDALKIPSASQTSILGDLNEALGYILYRRYQDKFVNKDKDELKKLMEQNKAKELIFFILKRTNPKELKKIVQEESEKIIKEFLQGYMKVLNGKQREEVMRKINAMFP